MTRPATQYFSCWPEQITGQRITRYLNKFYSWARENSHVTLVSGYPFDSSQLDLLASECVILHPLTRLRKAYGRTDRRFCPNQNFLDAYITKFFYHGAPVRALRGPVRKCFFCLFFPTTVKVNPCEKKRLNGITVLNFEFQVTRLHLICWRFVFWTLQIIRIF